MAARECPICYLPFDKSSHFISTCVPCGHCACQQCLSSLKNSQCPFCRTKFTQIIKIFVDSAEEETKPLRCGNCPNRADMFCPQCISNFCKSIYLSLYFLLLSLDYYFDLLFNLLYNLLFILLF